MSESQKDPAPPFSLRLSENDFARFNQACIRLGLNRTQAAKMAMLAFADAVENHHGKLVLPIKLIPAYVARKTISPRSTKKRKTAKS